MRRIAVIGSKAAFDRFMREKLAEHPDAIVNRSEMTLTVGERHFVFAGGFWIIGPERKSGK